MELRTCSDSNTSSTYPFIKYSVGVVLPAFKSLHSYVPKCIMVSIDPFKGLLPAFMTFLDNFRIKLNYVNTYLPNIIL